MGGEGGNREIMSDSLFTKRGRHFVFEEDWEK